MHVITQMLEVSEGWNYNIHLSVKSMFCSWLLIYDILLLFVTNNSNDDCTRI